MKGNMAGRIAALLEEKKMTQKDLALAAQITESAVSHYLNGDRIPRGVNLIKIAKALETTTDYLLEQESDFNQENDLKIAKTLIARNAPNMTKSEKMELLSIIMGDD